MPQGAQAVFDKRTHKRVLLQTTRLNFTYYAAAFLENENPKDVADSVLEHLEIAQEEISRSWGAVEFKRLGSATISSLDEFLRNTILEKLKTPENGLLVTPLGELPVEIHQPISEELGKNALGGVYRQRTQHHRPAVGRIPDTMGSCVSRSGWEAYACCDPLVQYKSRASGLFQEL
jgi:preprotein translocase subunit SecA